MLIRLENVRKEYQIGQQRVVALNDVNLVIAEGEFVSLMGPSGSGKSTLLNVLGGLDRPTSGALYVSDQMITTLPAAQLCKYRQAWLGFVFQKFNLLNALTARENVEFPLVFAGVPERERRERAAHALNAVGLSDRLDHRPQELSGGQQQRVAIARAVVTNAPIILADEPTGNLDTESGVSIMQLLAKLNGDGRTVIVVTHDLRMARYSTRVIRMLDGRIVTEAEHDAVGIYDEKKPIRVE